MMALLKRTDSTNPDFIGLVKKLDADLKIRDGDDHAFYSQYNKIDALKHAIIAYKKEIPIGCGAIKLYAPDVMEIKRMYVLPELRGNGIATMILEGLEKWAAEIGIGRCILETGVNQPEAISLYKKRGYNAIPNYGQYANVETSFCFEKLLTFE